MQCGLKRGYSIARLLTEVAQSNGRTPTDIVGVIFESLDQCWDDLSGIAFSLCQKARRNDAIFLLMRLEVTHQFFGRFLLLATTREQANEEN